MSLRIISKQPNARMCLVCGLENGAGLHARFFVLENQELLAIFKPRREHQGYPGRLHGGIAAAIMDEAIGRTVTIGEGADIWGVSIELTSRFRKPVPLEDEVRVVARITKNSARIFEGRGELLLRDGSIAVEARGRYLKMPLEKISDLDVHSEWYVVPLPDDPQEFSP